ncbi:MAG TPA: flagellin [Symbiobacteriaceae bacterium]|jgi:flagellin|nr:flagellin [Symbiobacteriaceae bacterium]
MRINTNVSSLNAWRNLTSTDGAMGKNLERLSSGFRINRAGDDVAGLAISENMRAQIKGLNQAVKNAQDGISLLQTAEGSLTEVHNMLHRMRELAVQSANGTLQPEDRKQIQTEMDNLAKEVTRITNATQFNGMDLIDGSLQSSGIRDVSLQIGPNGGQTVTFGIGAMDAESLGIARDVLVGTVDNGEHFDMTATNAAVTSVDALGAALDGNADYRIFADEAGATDTYTLQKSTDGGANWTNVGSAVNAAAGTLVLGNTVSGETVDITGLATVAADITLNITNSANIVAKIGEMGAGLSAGSFQVQYDTSNQHLKLVDSATGKDIGAFIDLNDPKVDKTKPLVLGDKNTAQTVEITLKSNLPTSGGASSVVTDNLTIQSVVGKVSHDVDDMLVDNGGVIAVGTGLKSNNYQIVATAANTIQLQDMNGVAIGNAVNVGATGGVVEIGDDSTNRTVKVDLQVAAIAINSTAVISVNNLEQHADAASFSGGAKQLNAQAYAGLNVSSVEGAQKAIASIDAAIGKVSYQRSQLGAITNRLDHTINNLSVVSENLTASESRIRDVDMALEMTQFTKAQILMQSGTAMLAQANQKNQAVLSLLR